jgi:hypothetical protein
MDPAVTAVVPHWRAGRWGRPGTATGVGHRRRPGRHPDRRRRDAVLLVRRPTHPTRPRPAPPPPPSPARSPPPWPGRSPPARRPLARPLRRTRPNDRRLGRRNRAARPAVHRAQPARPVGGVDRHRPGVRNDPSSSSTARRAASSVNYRPTPYAVSSNGSPTTSHPIRPHEPARASPSLSGSPSAAGVRLVDQVGDHGRRGVRPGEHDSGDAVRRTWNEHRRADVQVHRRTVVVAARQPPSAVARQYGARGRGSGCAGAASTALGPRRRAPCSRSCYQRPSCRRCSLIWRRSSDMRRCSAASGAAFSRPVGATRQARGQTCRRAPV